MAKLTLVMERTPIQVYELDRPVVQIGRVEGMEIVIDNVSVSRKQAEIRQDGPFWTVRDLGSSNGTYLNGQRLTDTQRLKVGDEISFGKFSLFFERVIAEAPAAARITPATGPTRPVGTYHLSAAEIERLQQKIAVKRQAQLDWEAAGLHGTHHIAGDSALVSRGDGADLRVPVVGPRKGIVFARTAEGFEVRNLASWFHFEPMRVNGRATSRAALKSGDRIEMGELRVTFRDEV